MRRPLGRTRAFDDLPDRVGLRGDLRTRVGHLGDALVGEFQAIEHGGGQPALAAGGQVFGIGLLQRLDRCFQRLGNGVQGLIALLARRGGGQAAGDQRAFRQ